MQTSFKTGILFWYTQMSILFLKWIVLYIWHYCWKLSSKSDDIEWGAARDEWLLWWVRITTLRLQDTVTVTFSCLKAAMALCVALLVDRKLLSYDDLVAKHWPAFGHSGKANITVQMLLSHTVCGSQSQGSLICSKLVKGGVFFNILLKKLLLWLIYFFWR